MLEITPADFRPHDLIKNRFTGRLGIVTSNREGKLRYAVYNPENKSGRSYRVANDPDQWEYLMNMKEKK